MQCVIPYRNALVGCCIEARAGAANLVDHIGVKLLTDEVLVPTHPSIRRGLPRFRAQAATMHDADRVMRFFCLFDRQHELHVHLIDHVQPRINGPGAHLRNLCMAPAASGKCRDFPG